MADTWSDIGNFLTKSLGTAGNALTTFGTLAGEAEARRGGGPLAPFASSLLRLPGVLQAESQAKAAIPSQAKLLAALTPGGKVSAEQWTSAINAGLDPAKVLPELLKPSAKAAEPKIFTPASGGAFKLDDNGNLVPVPAPPGAFAPKTKAETDTTPDFRQFLGANGIDPSKYLSLPQPQRLALYRSYQQGKAAQAAAMFSATLPGKIQVAKAGADIHNAEPPTTEQKIENSSRSVTAAKDRLALAGEVYDAANPGIKGLLDRAFGGRAAAIAQMRAVRDPNGNIAGFLGPNGQFLRLP